MGFYFIFFVISVGNQMTQLTDPDTQNGKKKTEVCTN